MKSLMAQQSIRFALVNRERGTTMDRETLSNYGWIVICVLVLAVMIALAPVFAAALRRRKAEYINLRITWNR